MGLSTRMAHPTMNSTQGSVPSESSVYRTKTTVDDDDEKFDLTPSRSIKVADRPENGFWHESIFVWDGGLRQMNSRGRDVPPPRRSRPLHLRTPAVTPTAISRFVIPLPLDSKATPCSITQKRTY